MSDPNRRKINRKIARQKSARGRQSERALSNPNDAEVQQRIELHTRKVENLKQERAELPVHQTEGSLKAHRPKVLRVLEGIPYWVTEDPREISELVRNHVRKEWEADIAEQKDHEEGSWLGSLEKRRWRLAITKLRDIVLSDQILDYVNEATGYNFRKRLRERISLLDRDLDRFGAVIRPVIVRAEDSHLMDGYCRYHVLMKRGIKETYAYIGIL